MTVLNAKDILFAEINTQYVQALGKKRYESRIRPLLSQIQTATGKVRLPIFFSNGNFREWTDEISVSNIETFFQDIELKRYAEGYRVNKDFIADSVADMGSMIQQSINSELELESSFADKKIAELFVKNPTIWDGTAFFANARPNLKSAAALNNIVPGTGITKMQVYADLSSAMIALESFKKTNGDPFFPYANFVAVIPQHLRTIFESIKTNEFIVNGETNDHRGKFDYVVNPFLPVNDWYLVNDAPEFKFAAEISSSNTTGQPVWNVIDEEKTNTFLYYSTMRGAVSLMNPLVVVKINN